MAYPASSCSPARGSVFGPQQTPASTSGGGADGIELDGGCFVFDKLERGWNDWVMIVIIPVESVEDYATILVARKSTKRSLSFCTWQTR